MEIIEEAQPFFIRCIRSNAEKVNWKKLQKENIKMSLFFYPWAANIHWRKHENCWALAFE